MPTKYPKAFTQRAVRMMQDRLQSDEDSLTSYQVITQTAPKLNVSVEALRRWVEQATIDAGIKPGVRSHSQEEIKRGKRDNATTAARQRDPHHCVSVFRRGAGPAHTEMIAYIDTYRDIFGVELICRTLGATEGGFITSRGYLAHKTRPC